MTLLLYLNDTYLFETDAKVMEIKEDKIEMGIILDKTIFYPQGGGQPPDSGEICSKNGVFKVKDVRIDKDGRVWHFGEVKKGKIKEGEEVHLKINKELRILHARLHSAGHLIDCALTKIGVKIKPTKGFHFPAGPYVEYNGIIENVEEVIQKLQEKVNELISQDLKLIAKELPQEEAKKLGINAPSGKSARIVYFESCNPTGCGGTHVNSSREIGKINIRKIKSKKGKTRISYSLD